MRVLKGFLSKRLWNLLGEHFLFSQDSPNLGGRMVVKKTRFEVRCGFEFWLYLILNELLLEDFINNLSLCFIICKMRYYFVELLLNVIHEASRTMPVNL